MKYFVKFSSRFKKSIKKFKSNKNFNKKEFDKVLGELLNGNILDKKYKNHTLYGEYEGMQECHIQNDILLVYYYIESDLILYAVDIGSHSELF